MRSLIFLSILPIMVWASPSLDEEIISDLDFYQNLEIVQESKNVIDINADTFELVSEGKTLENKIIEKGN